MSSKFIIVEGPDFCGKSTQLEMLELNTWYFNQRIFFTREPGSRLPESSLECEEIREEILHGNGLSLMDEANLFARSRYYHTKEIVKLLTEDDNTVVISDRYIISSYAYQGYAQGLGKDIIDELNEPSLKLLRDNDIEIHCIKFNISPETWEERKRARLQIEELDLIEQKDISKEVLDFFVTPKIFGIYTNDLKMEVHNINADRNIMAVYIDFLEIIKDIVNN